MIVISAQKLCNGHKDRNVMVLWTELWRSHLFSLWKEMKCSSWCIKIQDVLFHYSFPLKTHCNTALWLVGECWGETLHTEALVPLGDRKFASLHWLPMKSGLTLNNLDCFTRDHWRLHHIWRGWQQHIISTDHSSLNWMVTAGAFLSSPLISSNLL